MASEVIMSRIALADKQYNDLNMCLMHANNSSTKFPNDTTYSSSTQASSSLDDNGSRLKDQHFELDHHHSHHHHHHHHPFHQPLFGQSSTSTDDSIHASSPVQTGEQDPTTWNGHTPQTQHSPYFQNGMFRYHIRRPVESWKFYETNKTDGSIIYLCRLCGSSYKHKKSLNKHWKDKHSEMGGGDDEQDENSHEASKSPLDQGKVIAMGGDTNGGEHNRYNTVLEHDQTSLSSSSSPAPPPLAMVVNSNQSDYDPTHPDLFPFDDKENCPPVLENTTALLDHSKSHSLNSVRVHRFKRLSIPVGRRTNRTGHSTNAINHRLSCLPSNPKIQSISKWGSSIKRPHCSSESNSNHCLSIHSLACENKDVFYDNEHRIPLISKRRHSILTDIGPMNSNEMNSDGVQFINPESGNLLLGYNCTNLENTFAKEIEPLDLSTVKSMPKLNRDECLTKNKMADNTTINTTSTCTTHNTSNICPINLGDKPDDDDDDNKGININRSLLIGLLQTALNTLEAETYHLSNVLTRLSPISTNLLLAIGSLLVTLANQNRESEVDKPLVVVVPPKTNQDFAKLLLTNVNNGFAKFQNPIQSSDECAKQIQDENQLDDCKQIKSNIYDEPVFEKDPDRICTHLLGGSHPNDKHILLPTVQNNRHSVPIQMKSAYNSECEFKQFTHKLKAISQLNKSSNQIQPLTMNSQIGYNSDCLIKSSISMTNLSNNDTQMLTSSIPVSSIPILVNPNFHDDNDDDDYDGNNNNNNNNDINDNGGTCTFNTHSMGKRSDTVEQLIICPICRFDARWFSELRAHMVNHSEHRMFGCSYCHYRAKWKWDVAKHMRRCPLGRHVSHLHNEALLRMVRYYPPPKDDILFNYFPHDGFPGVGIDRAPTPPLPTTQRKSRSDLADPISNEAKKSVTSDKFEKIPTWRDSSDLMTGGAGTNLVPMIRDKSIDQCMKCDDNGDGDDDKENLDSFHTVRLSSTLNNSNNLTDDGTFRIDKINVSKHEDTTIDRVHSNDMNGRKYICDSVVKVRKCPLCQFKTTEEMKFRDHWNSHYPGFCEEIY